MRPTPRLLAIVALAGLVACGGPPDTAPPPVPAADPLEDWLLNSDTGRALRAAAEAQRWLAGVPGDVDELRVVMAAAGVDGVDGLEEVLEPHEDEFEELQAALRLRRPGSTRGDLAHWAGVSLLAFVEAEPDRSALPDTARWDDDYLDDIAELRGVSDRGNLAGPGEAAFVAPEPPPPGLIFAPRSGGFAFVRSLDEQVGWPLFPAPGAQTLSGARPLRAGELVETSDRRVQVRRAGFTRARTDFVQTVARYAIQEDGGLEFVDSWNLVLAADQTLPVVGVGDGRRGLWVWLGDGMVAAISADCCVAVENLDTLTWVRFGRDEGAPWTMVPDEAFEPVTWQEHREAEIAAGRVEESEPVYYERLGRIWGNSDRPEIAGARLSIFRAGDPQGPPLFVIHGEPGLGSRYLREPLARSVGITHQLIFWDQRGAGYSAGADDPDAITMRRMVDDLERIRQRAELEQIEVLAHGFGALIAAHYDAAYPDRLGKLVLVDPDPITRAEWDRILAARESLAMTDARKYGLMADEFVRSNIEITRELVRDDLADWDITPILQGLEVPTLVIAGASGTPGVATRYHAALPQSELVLLPRAGRFCYADAPGPFLEATLEFLLGGETPDEPGAR